MNTTLEDLPIEQPGWLFAGKHVDACPPEEAAAFLSALDKEDLHLLVLHYGLGMRVGGISQVMRLDPALVVWRLYRAFQRRMGRETGAIDQARLERGISGLLRHEGETPPTPPEGAAGWTVRELLHDLDDGVRERLEVRLEQGSLDQAPTSKMGVGLLLAVLAVALGFLAFGVVRDVDPMERGESLMRQSEFARARDAFLKVGTLEARVKVVLCLLAEGRFEAAVADLAEEPLRSRFRSFAPGRQPGRLKDLEPGGRALLPRGPVMMARPEFVIAAGPPGILRVRSGGREHALSLPDTRGGSSRFATIGYPEDWPPLWGGRVHWSVDDGDGGTAWFDVIEVSTAREVRERNQKVLTRDVPRRAQTFLRAQSFMNQGLFVQAGQEFAELLTDFPESRYLRDQLSLLGQVMGIDPAALLR